MRALIADDHSLVREGIKLAVQKVAESVTVLEAADGNQVRRLVAENPGLDIILLDLFMPHADGFSLLKDLCDAVPDTPILILTASQDAGNMRKAIDWGAAGYITKSAGQEELQAAFHQVLAGGVYVPDLVYAEADSAHAALLPNGSLNPESQNTAEIPKLTNRQLHVLSLLCLGKTNKDIGRMLSLSEYTVKVHITAIFKVLKVRNRTEAVLEARRFHLLPRSNEPSSP